MIFLRGIVLLLFGVVYCFFASAATHPVSLTTTIVDGLTFGGGVAPGDTLMIEGPIREHLILRNLQGTATQPIVITKPTYLEAVSISSNIHYAVSIQNCQHFIFTGKTTLSDKGFIIRAPTGVGMGVGAGSGNYVIESVIFSTTDGPALLAKTDPDCSWQYDRNHFTQGKTVVRDCSFNQSGTEAIYIGSTAFNGQTINCNGKDTLLLPHLIDTVLVYNNYIINCGWDGIQVSSSRHVAIHNNEIVQASTKKEPWQKNGIIMGGGSAGLVYNNQIIRPFGTGIANFTSGPVYYFNNVISNEWQPNHSASESDYGFYIDSGRNPSDTGYVAVFNNLVLRPQKYGFRVVNPNVGQRDSVINNILIGGNLSQTAAYNFQNAANVVSEKNLNFKDLGCFSDGIVPILRDELPQYATVPNQGILLPAILPYPDFFGNPRWFGASMDIGPVETQEDVGLGIPIWNEGLHIFPNPVVEGFQFFTPISSSTCRKALATLTLHALDGTLSWQDEQIFEPGILFKWERTPNISSGFYIFTIETQSYRHSAKVLIKND